MSRVGFLVTFLITWWLFFFMALPFGAAPEENPEPGHVESAPAKPRLWLKAFAATVLALGATMLLDWVIRQGWIQLRPDHVP